jgi:hypothetical protein
LCQGRLDNLLELLAHGSRSDRLTVPVKVLKGGFQKNKD